MAHSKEVPFYKKGLQFECIQCGKCCTGYPGFVYLSETDIKSISEYLHCDKRGFIKKYTKTVRYFYEERFSLNEKSNYDCIFWDKICTIYPSRPHQCRTYPFWKRNLVSEREWNKTAKFCPGINRGQLYSFEEILMLSTKVLNYDIGRFDPHFLKELE